MLLNLSELAEFRCYQLSFTLTVTYDRVFTITVITKWSPISALPTDPD